MICLTKDQRPKTKDFLTVRRFSRVLSLVSWVLCLMFIIFSANFAAAKGKRTMHPKDMFDHDMHTENFFVAAEVPCESCHVNEQYTWKTMNHDGCHQCHGGREKSPMPANSDCSMCHENWTVAPASHKAGWEASHKVDAKLHPNTCKSCHTDRYCITCHDQRSDITPEMHKRNYKFFHSVDVRANPKKCDRCHQVAFCTSCHTSRRGR